VTVAEIVTRIASAADAIKAEGATDLYICGSRGRGTGREDTDPDVFVDYEPGFGFSLIRPLGRSSRRAAGAHLASLRTICRLLRAAVVAMQRDPALWPWLAGHEAYITAP
jgi:hypothetical protein